MTQQAEAFDPVQESHMTLMEHLIELRTRLIWVAGALLVGTLVAMIFVNPILRFITEPLTELGAETIAIGPTDTITIFFKVSITVGAVFAMPVIVYQLIAFVAPGLYPHEKRTLLLILPGIMVLFLTGAAFAYFVLMPVAVGFLQGFLGDVIRQEWTIDRYIGFVTRVVFWIGVAFEMPLVLAFLARAGIVTGRQLLGFWRQAVVIIAVVAAAITPTVDPINMSIVMGPLLLLYLGSCGLAYLVYRPREPRDFSDGFLPHDDEDDAAGDGRDGDDEPPAGPSGATGAAEQDDDSSHDEDDDESAGAEGPVLSEEYAELPAGDSGDRTEVAAEGDAAEEEADVVPEAAEESAGGSPDGTEDRSSGAVSDVASSDGEPSDAGAAENESDEASGGDQPRAESESGDRHAAVDADDTAQLTVEDAPVGADGDHPDGAPPAENEDGPAAAQPATAPVADEQGEDPFLMDEPADRLAASDGDEEADPQQVRDEG